MLLFLLRHYGASFAQTFSPSEITQQKHWECLEYQIFNYKIIIEPNYTDQAGINGRFSITSFQYEAWLRR